MIKKTIKKYIAIAAILIAAIAFYMAHYFVPRLIVQTGDPVNKFRKLTAQYQNPKEIGLNYDSLLFISNEGFKLQAYFIPTTADSIKGSIIMLHGIRAYKEYFLAGCPQFVNAGYNIILPDNRAHGESEGAFCTFGVMEKQDVSILIDTLSRRYHLENIGIWGQSLGGAIAMQALAAEPRLQFGIIESTFTSFKEVAHDYIHRIIPFFPRFFRSYLIHRAAQIAHFNADDASPILAAAQIKQPILLVHGTADSRIKFDYAKQNFDALATENKVFLPITGADHIDVWKIGGPHYFDSILKFLSSTKKNGLRL